VLIKELVHTEVATADAHRQLPLDEAHFNALSSELVLAGRLTQKHHFQLVAVGVVVHEVSQFGIDCVVFEWYVDANFRFKVHTVDLDRLDLLSLVADLFE